MNRKRLSVLSRLFRAGLFVCFAFTFVSAQSSGGPFRLDSTVIANGGGTASATGYTIEATLGQPLAGTVSTGGSFSVQSDFWTSTASFYSVSGRVMTASGRGVTNARVTLDDNGVLRTVVTGRLGFYYFGGVAAGRIYTLSVDSLRYSFPNNPRAVSVNAGAAIEDFIASP